MGDGLHDCDKSKQISRASVRLIKLLSKAIRQLIKLFIASQIQADFSCFPLQRQHEFRPSLLRCFPFNWHAILAMVLCVLGRSEPNDLWRVKAFVNVSQQ